jgi:hypothetical protein
MTVTFCFLKQNREDDVVTSQDKYALNLKIYHSNNPVNLVLSPTLRILTLMIRRGILVNIDIVEDLLDNDGPMNVEVKPGFLDSPATLGGW